MASLAKEKGKYYRIHWSNKVTAGPQAGRSIPGSIYIDRCTRVVAKTRLREVEVWEETVKTGRHLPDGGWEEVYGLWLREKQF